MEVAGTSARENVAEAQAAVTSAREGFNAADQAADRAADAWNAAPDRAAQKAAERVAEFALGERREAYGSLEAAETGYASARREFTAAESVLDKAQDQLLDATSRAPCRRGKLAYRPHSKSPHPYGAGQHGT